MMIRLKNLRAILALALLMGITPFMPSCTDGEIIASGIGAGLGIWALSEHAENERLRRDRRHHDHYCEHETREVCNNWQDRWGRWHQDCRQYRERRGCMAYQPTPGLGGDAPLSFRDIEPADKVTALDVALRGGMSEESAQFLLTALEEAKAGNYEKVVELGFNRKEMAFLQQNMAPSEALIDKMSIRLNQKYEATAKMVEEIMAVLKVLPETHAWFDDGKVSI